MTQSRHLLKIPFDRGAARINWVLAAGHQPPAAEHHGSSVQCILVTPMRALSALSAPKELHNDGFAHCTAITKMNKNNKK